MNLKLYRNVKLKWFDLYYVECSW